MIFQHGKYRPFPQANFPGDYTACEHLHYWSPISLNSLSISFRTPVSFYGCCARAEVSPRKAIKRERRKKSIADRPSGGRSSENAIQPSVKVSYGGPLCSLGGRHRRIYKARVFVTLIFSHVARPGNATNLTQKGWAKELAVAACQVPVKWIFLPAST